LRHCSVNTFASIRVAIINLPGNAYLSSGFRDRDTPVDVDLGFVESIDDMLRSEALSVLLD
jgi:hypothetical protein